MPIATVQPRRISSAPGPSMIVASLAARPSGSFSTTRKTVLPRKRPLRRTRFTAENGDSRPGQVDFARMGIMGGCRRQAATAQVGFVAWHAVGLPAAAAFAFYFELQLLGIRIGFACGLLFSVCTMGMCVGRMSWEDWCRRPNHKW